MRTFRVNVKRKFVYIKILKETEKSYLTLMRPKIIIWVPKYMVSSISKKIMYINDKYASEIRTRIRAEKLALKK